MSLGAPEIIGIIVLALLLFGSRKLPELGSSVGKTITNFKQGMSEAKDEDKADAATSQPPVPASPVVTNSVTTTPDATTANGAEPVDKA